MILKDDSVLEIGTPASKTTSALHSVHSFFLSSSAIKVFVSFIRASRQRGGIAKAQIFQFY